MILGVVAVLQSSRWMVVGSNLELDIFVAAKTPLNIIVALLCLDSLHRVRDFIMLIMDSR